MHKFVIIPLLGFYLVSCNFPIANNPISTSSSPEFTQSAPSTSRPGTGTDEVTPFLPYPVVSSPTSHLIITPVESAMIPPNEPYPPVPNLTPTPEDHLVTEEAIMILEPGPGSTLTNPIHVAGIAGPVFEQTLGIRFLLDDGTVLALGPVIIDAEPGKRGVYSEDLPFVIEGERQAFIQVFATSPRDGGVIHLSSVGVILAEAGTQEIRKADPYPERINISQPSADAPISGGTVHVEGFALASFEQTLLVEVQDAEGKVVGSQPVIVDAPDMGVPGPFRIDVPYSVQTTGPGRIDVRDISPAFGGDVHLASIEVILAP